MPGGGGGGGGESQIAFVAATSGRTGGAGSETITLPSHSAGDLLVVLETENNTDVVPSAPAGWTRFVAVGANSCAMAAYYRVATSGSETPPAIGTFTEWVAASYSGVNATPTGATAANAGIGTDWTFPALTPDVADGSSWILGMAMKRNADANMPTPPAGMTHRDNEVLGMAAALHDTNGGVASFAADTVAGAAASTGWHAVTVELKSA